MKMKKTVALLVIGLFQITASADTRVIPLMEAEQFWGGCVTDGQAMPFGATDFERDLHGDTRGNQAQPLLISNKGRDCPKSHVLHVSTTLSGRFSHLILDLGLVGGHHAAANCPRGGRSVVGREPRI